ncbi:MAG TPA: hypothetical protein VNK95_11995, partial [Caldilineaceae bacterium]|nr:hypothetical protein [Caldilineaceae bacterium]
MMAWLRPLVYHLLAWLCLLSLLLFPRPAYAQASAAPVQEQGLAVTAEGGGVRLRWDGGGAMAAAAGLDGNPALPLVPYGGYLIPMHTLPLESAEATAAAVHQVESVVWTGEPARAPELAPPALDWEPPAQQGTPPPALPAAPLFALYAGMQRGRPVTVWAFSPLYQDPHSGEVRWVERLDATIAGAQPANLAGEAAVAAPDQESLFTPVAALAAAPGPTNPLAGRQAAKLFVSQEGLQQVSAAALAAAGLNGPRFPNLRIYWRGQEVALHESDLNGNGVMDGSDSLFFYAPPPADRWNPEEVYWLVADSATGLRMAARNGQWTGAPARASAVE